jgi:hypothetical protein
MTNVIEFQPFPKIPRLKRGCVITEKIDGTNAQIIITEDGQIGAASRNRLVTPTDDNYGFAGWVERNKDVLIPTLGPGRHFGEWWGAGIQRGYGLKGNDKRFSLFNVNRWKDVELPPVLSVVPKLYEGEFSTDIVDLWIDYLRLNGSKAVPGFKRPEGIIVYHVAAQSLFKVLIEDDDKPKGLAEAA